MIGIEGDGWVRRGVGVGFGCFREAGGDGVLMSVAFVRGEVFLSADGMVGEASLPDGELGREAVGEASFDEANGTLDCDFERCEQEVDVVGHHDEGVEFEVASEAVMLEGFEEEGRIGVGLEEATAV